MVNRRARDLGLSRTKEKPWSPEEVNYLASHYHKVPLYRLTLKLRRTKTAIKLKAKRLGYSKKGEGYTSRSLARALGVDQHWVTKRIVEGKLRVTRRGTDRLPQQGGDYYLITENALIAMIRQYPQELDIRKVDQVWFMDLVASRLKAPNNKREEVNI